MLASRRTAGGHFPTLPLLLDDDFLNDPGDWTGLGAVIGLHKQRRINLLGVGVNAKGDHGPGAVSAVLDWAGMSSIPICSFQGSAPVALSNETTEPQTIYAGFSHTLGLVSGGGGAAVPEAVTTFRTLLAARTQPDVIWLINGHFTILDAVLDSAGDGISPLNGIDLVAASVKRVVTLAGQYPSGSEYNIDRAPAAAAAAISACPVPIIFAGFEAGFYQEGTTLVGEPASNPIKSVVSSQGRQGWETFSSMMAAVHEPADVGCVVIEGTNAVDAGTGANVFTPGAGTHKYVIQAGFADEYKTEADRLVVPQADKRLRRIPFRAAQKVMEWDASTLGLSNGALCSTLPDAIGGRDLTQAGALRPTFITALQNGLAGLRFGGTQYMKHEAASDDVITNPNVTVFNVVARKAYLANAGILSFSRLADPNDYAVDRHGFICGLDFPFGYSCDYTEGEERSKILHPGDDVPMIVTSRWRASEVLHTISGVDGAKQSSCLTRAVDSLALAIGRVLLCGRWDASAVTLPATYDFFQAQVWEGYMSDAEIAANQADLAAKWDIGAYTPPPALLYDSFTRADSTTTLDDAETGQVWTPHTGTWGIASNKAYLATQVGDSVVTADAGISDFDMSVDVTCNGQPAIVFRAVDDQNLLLLTYWPGGNQLQLFKRVAGTYTQLNSVALTLGAGTDHTFRVTGIANRLEAYIDGVNLMGATTSQFNTATRYGLRQNDAAAARYDTLAVGAA